jgi:hypothetical protein
MSPKAMRIGLSCAWAALASVSAPTAPARAMRRVSVIIEVLPASCPVCRSTRDQLPTNRAAGVQLMRAQVKTKLGQS